LRRSFDSDGGDSDLVDVDGAPLGSSQVLVADSFQGGSGVFESPVSLGFGSALEDES